MNLEQFIKMKRERILNERFDSKKLEDYNKTAISNKPNTQNYLKNANIVKYLREVRANSPSGIIRFDMIDYHKIQDSDFQEVPIQELKNHPLRYKFWLLFYEDKDHDLIGISYNKFIIAEKDYNQNKTLNFRFNIAKSTNYAIGYFINGLFGTSYCFGVPYKKLEKYINTERFKARVEWNEFCDKMKSLAKINHDRYEITLKSRKFKSDLQKYKEDLFQCNDELIKRLDYNLTNQQQYIEKDIEVLKGFHTRNITDNIYNRYIYLMKLMQSVYRNINKVEQSENPEYIIELKRLIKHQLQELKARIGLID